MTDFSKPTNDFNTDIIEVLKRKLIQGDDDAVLRVFDLFYQRIKQDHISDEDTFFSESETMDFLKISSKTTLWNYRTKMGLPFYQIGKRIILYRKSELIDFIQEHKMSY